MTLYQQPGSISDWLKIRSGCGILIYSACLGLRNEAAQKANLDQNSMELSVRNLRTITVDDSFDTFFIAPDKAVFTTERDLFFFFNKIIFLFLHKNIYCGYSLEAPHRVASN